MTTILQQESVVEMLKIMVSTGRAKKNELDAAIATLNAMRGPVQPTTVSTQSKEPVVATAIVPVFETKEPVFIETIFQRKGQLMDEIKKLTAEQSQLSNRLCEIPEDVVCPELTKEIVKLRKRIEQLWTEYRFIDRNGQLPKIAKDNTEAPQDPDKDIKLLRIASDLKSLRDKRGKLEKKLSTPLLATKNPDTKIPEWQTELTQVLEAISELEYQKELLGD